MYHACMEVAVRTCTSHFAQLHGSALEADADADVLQGLSNVLWAFAKLEVRAPKLLKAAGAEIVRRVDSFSSRDMAEALWAFAKLDHTGSPEAVQALINRMEHILRSGGAISKHLHTAPPWLC